MEAKKLMIDDYVSYIDTFGKRRIGKVTDLHHNESWETIYVDFCDQNPERKSKIRCVRPIPLTEEILQRNGFKLTEISDEYYDDFEPRRFWEYSTDTKEILNINIKIDENVNTSIDAHNGDGVQMLQYFTDRNILYVHELQHTLRLVGLNEMADNLK